MAKTRKKASVFFCQECGHESVGWLGRCPSCEAWNSLVEEPVEAGSGPPGMAASLKSTAKVVRMQDVEVSSQQRFLTGLGEFDRVLGGGIVPGSVILVAGDPGIGKSTLMTGLGGLMPDRTILYVTGEESVHQVKMRADRLELGESEVFVLAETRVEDILASAIKIRPDILVIDSVQTLYSSEVSSSPGSVGQVRACAAMLIRQAKQHDLATFLVGHVTKDGQIAGPRVLEHMVDTVLSFEGDRHHSYRILRSVKNRFGSTDEIGLFDMAARGLVEIADPSSALIANRSNQSGAAVICPIEGTRPLLLEVQALVTTASYGTPQRSATGVESRRLQMLLAVLEKRAGVRLAGEDVFLNVAGGIRIDEPAADLGVVMAVASSHRNQALPNDTIFVGEIGLGGEVRAVPSLERRLNEASRLGFRHGIGPATAVRPGGDLSFHPVSNLNQAIDLMF
jgi:DNA repair protein RadA/Sms